MDQQELFVKMALQAWEINSKRITAVFNKLTDEELLQEIAPGRNRVIYLLGHLTAVNDSMLTLLGFGNKEFPQLEEIFLSKPDRAVAELPPAKTLREYWTKSSETLAAHFARLSAAEWFQRHTSMTDEDLVKEPHRNRLAVLISRTNHLSFHLGQLVLVKK
jgi:uncharacterized damage-inducible protein DinB